MQNMKVRKFRLQKVLPMLEPSLVTLDEEEGEVEAYEDLEVIVQGAYHKNESETVNGQTADAKRPSNSVKEDAHFLSHHNINNGFSEAIEILRKSGSLNQGVPHKGSNGCCRDNIQMISQV